MNDETLLSDMIKSHRSMKKLSTFTTGAVVKVASGKHIFLLTISIAVHWCPTTNIFCGRRASNLSLAGRHIRANPPISRVIPLEQRMQHPVANRASPRLAPSSATYFHFSILALYTELRFLAAPTAPARAHPTGERCRHARILALMRLSFC